MKTSGWLANQLSLTCWSIEWLLSIICQSYENQVVGIKIISTILIQNFPKCCLIFRSYLFKIYRKNIKKRQHFCVRSSKISAWFSISLNCRFFNFWFHHEKVEGKLTGKVYGISLVAQNLPFWSLFPITFAAHSFSVTFSYYNFFNFVLLDLQELSKSSR